MKTKNFILSVILLFIGTFLFTGCSTQKNYNMSYEQIIALLENQSKEMMEIFFDVDAQQKYFDLSTKLDMSGINLDLNAKSQARVDYDSMLQDTDISFDADVKVLDQELDFNTSWAVKYSLIWDDMYLKLSKFALKWPSASDLAMVTMIVNSVKWQWFKLSMSGFSMSKAFDLHSLYNEKLWEMANKAGDAMINEWSGVYDWMFDDYKWYNAWKYSIDKQKFDEMLQVYVEMMNEFYSWLFSQYVQNLWANADEMWLIDFGSMLSWITYDNLQWYFVVVWKNDVVETMEDAHINIDGTWIVVNYYYWKDWLYFEVKTEEWEDMMLIVAKRNGKTYSVYANMNSMLGVKWDLKFNKFSKKGWIDVDFDLNLTVNINSGALMDSEISNDMIMDIPLKWNYKVKSIDNFSLQEPKDAVDLMEMFGGYLWTMGETEYLDEWYGVGSR